MTMNRSSSRFNFFFLSIIKIFIIIVNGVSQNISKSLSYLKSYMLYHGPCIILDGLKLHHCYFQSHCEDGK